MVAERLNAKYRFFLPFLLVAAAYFSVNACGQTTFFLVGEIDKSYNESYVLPLTEANDIAHARNLIAYGPNIGLPLVVAQIDAGMDGINRNYFAFGKPVWSWHVQFISFAGTTPEILDGWPGWVQTDLDWWMTIGSIGFWSYTVVAELGTDLRPWRCDFDTDNDVDLKDFSRFSSYWSRQDCSAPLWCGGADLDSSGKVDTNDLEIFIDNWIDQFVEKPLWSECWNNQRQCHGDADGLKRGSASTGYYYVELSDLYIIQQAFDSNYGDIDYNPCADFDRDLKVNDYDYDIFQNWFEVAEPPIGPGVPADCPECPY